MLQDQEQHESDLRGSRGVLLVGVLMLIMAFSNFRNTVRHRVRLLHAASIISFCDGSPWTLKQMLLAMARKTDSHSPEMTGLRPCVVQVATILAKRKMKRGRRPMSRAVSLKTL